MKNQSIAIVTGASRGIGAATAIVLAQRGYHLTLVARDQECLADIGKKVMSMGVEVMSLPGDLSDLSFVESIAQKVWQRWGKIDVLVNNAAWREITTMRDITIESWERTLRVCLTAPAFLARWVAQYMEQRRSGVIVNVSSIMAERAAGICPAYIASKGAMNSLTFELASLYGPHGIRVVGISPGAIDTEMSRDLDKTMSPPNDPTLKEDMIMLRRWGTPEEVAKAIAWVSADDASYLTGTTLVLDGGLLHQHFPHSLRSQDVSDRL